MPQKAKSHKATCQVISASRRTDLPAFHTDWFMEHIREGWVSYRNPFGGKFQHVSLQPKDVHSIVFWSKDYRPLFPHLDELIQRDYRLAFHFTITGLPRLVEPNVPSLDESIEAFTSLSQRFSPKHVFWRFDPIIYAPSLGDKEHLERFIHIGKSLQGKALRCYTSFTHFYPKVHRRLAKLESTGFSDPPLDQKRQLVGKMAEIAADLGFELYACCSDILLQPGVLKGHCIDGELLAELFPEKPRISETRPTRTTCGCYASRDIGTYGTCSHGCIYCYAN